MRILYYIFSSPDKWAFHRRYFRCVDFRTTSVAGGVGSGATAEAVDGRAKAVQLRDKRSRLIATPDCNSHVEADNGNHTFSPPRQICRAWCRATLRLAARTTSSATLVRSRMHFSHASNHITSANAVAELYITVFKVCEMDAGSSRRTTSMALVPIWGRPQCRPQVEYRQNHLQP